MIRGETAREVRIKKPFPFSPIALQVPDASAATEHALGEEDRGLPSGRLGLWEGGRQATMARRLPAHRGSIVQHTG
jgi:hypothetical protein